jgi:hypothetical protein
LKTFAEAAAAVDSLLAQQANGDEIDEGDDDEMDERLPGSPHVEEPAEVRFTILENV